MNSKIEILEITSEIIQNCKNKNNGKALNIGINWLENNSKLEDVNDIRDNMNIFFSILLKQSIIYDTYYDLVDEALLIYNDKIYSFTLNFVKNAFTAINKDIDLNKLDPDVKIAILTILKERNDIKKNEEKLYKLKENKTILDLINKINSIQTIKCNKCAKEENDNNFDIEESAKYFYDLGWRTFQVLDIAVVYCKDCFKIISNIS